MQARQKKSKNKPSRQNTLSLWGRHHRYAIRNAITSLMRSRWTVLINSIILGLSLSLPLALISATNHTDIFTNTLNSAQSNVLYLQLSDSTYRSNPDELLDRLGNDPRIDKLSYHSREDVLDQVLEQLAIESTAELETLNPFFDIVEVTLQINPTNKTGFENFLGALKADKDITSIEHARENKNLTPTSFIGLFQRFTHALSIIVLVTTLLICGYMVRNQILRQQLEIEVTRYCGAEESFIRRPFLYWGAAQGFLGASCAGLIVYICFSLLILPMIEPATGARTTNFLTLFYPYEMTATIFIGSSLGLMGAWIAAKLQLSALSNLENTSATKP